MTLHTIRRGLVLTLLTFACGAHLFGQAGVANGSIRGMVQDSSGASVVKAAADARNLDTGFARSAITDETGSFELRLLCAALRGQRHCRGRTALSNALTASGLTCSPTKPSVTDFAHDFSVTVGLQYYGGRRMPLLIDVNLGSPTSFLADGRPVFSNANRPNPNFTQILQLQSVANSTYYGGFAALSKRFSRTVQFTVSYTLGWAFNQNDSTGDTASSPTDSTNIRRDYGTSSSDHWHRFVIQGVWQPSVSSHGLAAWLVDGWMVAPNFTATSAFPVTVLQGTDLNGDSVNNDRLLFRGRNGAVVSTFNAADFRRITSTFNSRQIQLGGRLRF